MRVVGLAKAGGVVRPRVEQTIIAEAHAAGFDARGVTACHEASHGTRGEAHELAEVIATQACATRVEQDAAKT
jgi:hypothetical protein